MLVTVRATQILEYMRNLKKREGGLGRRFIPPQITEPLPILFSKKVDGYSNVIRYLLHMEPDVSHQLKVRKAAQSFNSHNAIIVMARNKDFKKALFLIHFVFKRKCRIYVQRSCSRFNGVESHKYLQSISAK